MNRPPLLLTILVNTVAVLLTVLLLIVTAIEALLFMVAADWFVDSLPFSLLVALDQPEVWI